MSDDKMREAFEAWAKDDGLNVARYTSGPYIISEARRAWSAWQAATQAQAGQAEARDAERLDWLDGQAEAYGFADIHEGNRWLLEGAYGNIRQAIDHERAAMGATPPDSGEA